MRTKRSQAAANELICAYGTARFYALRKPARPGARGSEFKRNWQVRFHCAGRTWEESAGPCYPVADGLREVKLWAETRMASELAAARAGKLEQYWALVRPPKAVMLPELGQVYLAHVPPGKSDYVKNWQRLRSIACEMTGSAEADIEVTDAVFSRARLLGWVRMRQEHWRRGWAQKGATPADGWDVLRRELAANRLPGIDKTTEMECNTTIKTYLRCAKAVFANHREYLVGLQLPELSDFMQFSVDLRAPEGHREIDPTVMARLVADLPRLQAEQPRVFAFGQILAWMAGRPGVVKNLRGDALTVCEDGTGVITLPGAKGGNEVRCAVGAECVQAVLAVRTDASLIGARSATDAAKIDRAHRAWMTGHGVTGTLKNYLFRHMRLNQLRNVFDARTAMEAGGHTSEAMVNRKYTRNEKVVPMLPPLLVPAQAAG